MQHRRRSIRLPEYDYSSGGWYYVTICAQNMAYDFGIIIDNKIKLTKIGEIAKRYWFKIPEHFKNIKLDEFVVMPNHLHGIIVIDNVGVQNFEPLRKNKYQQIIPKSLGSVIRTYKSAVTKWTNQNGYNYFRWQRNYYERIIRNNPELNRIRNYIINNPINWETDRNNPKNLKTCLSKKS